MDDSNCAKDCPSWADKSTTQNMSAILEEGEPVCEFYQHDWMKPFERPLGIVDRLTRDRWISYPATHLTGLWPKNVKLPKIMFER